MTLFLILLDHFGDEDTALAFLRAFAGQVIRIPDNSRIERIATRRRGLRSMLDDPSETNVRRLAQFHGVSPRWLVKEFQDRTGKMITAHRAELAARKP